MYNQKKLFGHLYNSTLVYILELDCIMVRCNTGTRTRRIQEMDYSQRWCSFFTLIAPSYTPLSMAAATVRVPPITANTPVKNPDKVFVRSSRLITFIGDMSYLLMLVSIEFLLNVVMKMR